MSNRLIKIDMTGIENVEKAIVDMGLRINPTVVLDEAAASLLDRNRKRFRRRVDPDEIPWLPSKAGEKRMRGGFTYHNGRRYTGTGTLFESGTLFHSIQLFAATENTREIGTDVAYAKYHQEGIGQVPRPFLGISKSDETVFEKIVMRHLDEAFGKS